MIEIRIHGKNPPDQCSSARGKLSTGPTPPPSVLNIDHHLDPSQFQKGTLVSTETDRAPVSP